MKINTLFFSSLAAFTLSIPSLVYAQEIVTVPMLEGGVTATIGTVYAQTSADNTSYGFGVDSTEENEFILDTTNVIPDYEFGIQASIGYLFDDTANGIELSYRNLDTSDTASTFGAPNENSGLITGDIDSNLGYEFNAFDLLISQYMNIGEHMQMRFVGGLAYVELEQNLKSNIDYSSVPPGSDNITVNTTQDSEFTGWGPRVGIDTRYSFNQGVGIVGGASVAYYLGDLDLSNVQGQYNFDDDVPVTYDNENDIDSHSVTNLRANLGIDYVYVFDNEESSTLGLELGYQVDYYSEAVATLPAPTIVLPVDVTFSGPYVNLKGVF